MNVLTVLVTYNRKELLRESLDALYASTVPSDILVIDNASTDGTLDSLKDDIKQGKIRYFCTKENIGGAGGFSMAAGFALKEGRDYVWLMDDDTIVHPDTLEKLIEQARAHPEGAFFSSKALWTDGKENRMNAHRLLEKDHGQKAVKCREATFVSMLVKTSAIKELGLPIAEFFIWGDDIEYSRRLSKKYPCYYVPGSEVLHKTKTNAGSDIAIDDPARLGRYRYAYRNEVYMARKEGLYREARQLAKILYHTARILLKSQEARKEKIRIVWSASKEGLSFNPEIRYK